jgi:hypothetical protein
MCMRIFIVTHPPSAYAGVKCEHTTRCPIQSVNCWQFLCNFTAGVHYEWLVCHQSCYLVCRGCRHIFS